MENYNQIPVAVIISVYGRDDPMYFRESLTSISHQITRCDVRIYLYIDGAVNSSILAVVDKFRPLIFKILSSPENKGLSHALNSLIGSLSDEVFVFRMDADDISRLHRIETTVDFMLKSEVDVAGGWIEEFGDCVKGRRVVKFPVHHNSIRASLPFRSPLAHPTVCFTRRVFQAGLRYPDVRFNEDVALWFRLMREGYVFGNVPSVLLDYRMGAEFFSRRSLKKAFKEVSVYFRGLSELKFPVYYYVFPIIRLCVRMLPLSLIHLVYEVRARLWGFGGSLFRKRV